MAELDHDQMLAQAESNGQLYKIKKGWRNFIFFAGFLMCILIITIPFGIWFFVVGARAKIGLTQEGFAVSWFFKKTYAWKDVQDFQPQRLNMSGGGQGGLVGALIVAAASEAIARKSKGLNGPLMFKLMGKKQQLAIQAHAVENSYEMAREMERLSGLPILVTEDGKIN